MKTVVKGYVRTFFNAKGLTYAITDTNLKVIKRLRMSENLTLIHKYLSIRNDKNGNKKQLYKQNTDYLLSLMYQCFKSGIPSKHIASGVVLLYLKYCYHKNIPYG